MSEKNENASKAGILATLTAGAITYALENAEAFHAWMVTTAEEQGDAEMVASIPPVEFIEMGLAVAGMSVIEAAEVAGLVGPDELADQDAAEEAAAAEVHGS